MNSTGYRTNSSNSKIIKMSNQQTYYNLKFTKKSINKTNP